ncbi:hypothetical protein SERLA73DRAFT_68825 [Serpula lacrymans var. lacrymans S7.3]|uniref:RNA-dependent RNA polymerase n=2 Tax=Serpula lacrymans var. lacrymans TaxID=341189 RepID=F8PIF3_SERL3|nr:uncharacterized protein SERLADRAFT_432597 [Serpula lacrymans var. lacrymans S7.9]EGO05196.1 hypothetical protein SERLA73DRAFT_68825 [Serpula lacrymans var. lacrymans S7.3]EGO30936.1 hypothetical protein SERLADRAFT_432597 [Serpula lacrymans var. lacrymans S7.9]
MSGAASALDPVALARGASTESLVSTQSSHYSGLDDISDLMCQVPEEAYYYSTNDSKTSNGDSDLVFTSSPQSNPPSILGKRRAEDPRDSDWSLPSSSSRSRRTDESFESSAESAANPNVPFIIAHSPQLQKCFDARQISYGVQWLIARSITMGALTYDNINVPDLDKLKGSNEQACPMTQQIIRQTMHKLMNTDMKGYFVRETAAKSPWKELDREQSYYECQKRHEGWYPGKVQFTAKLKAVNDKKANAEYRIVLNWPELGPSSRFTRQFASKNFIRVRIDKSIINTKDNRLLEFFSKRFVLSGLVFRAFFAKDMNVFLVATDETAPGLVTSLPKHAIPYPVSFSEFLDWHNPIMLNAKQSMAKWASRFALGLSNSVPGILLEESKINKIEDEVSERPEASDLTDGCGFINRIALKTLRRQFLWDSFPTAIQCRIAGAKGLLLLHPGDLENDSDDPAVWLRPSQIKIKYSPDAPAPAGRLTIDVLRSSHMSSPSRLAAETIINLAENGVPHEVFVNLMKSGVDSIVDGLMDWDGPDAMFRLWFSVARSGGVVSARMAREVGGEARARGYGVKDVEDTDDDDSDEAPVSAAWWGDEVSGCPSSLEETVMVLLDAGFTPGDCPILADKLKHIIDTSVDNYVQRYRVDVPMSCIAFMVPDPTGTLGPGEIHIKSSHPKFLCEDGTETDIVLGDVLLTRHPCKLPTDVQKVRAVEKAELRHFKDVIVCPVKGTNRRFADLLAGGDYDGDKAIAIWQKEIVSPFKNADLKYSHPPADLPAQFSKNNVIVSDFLRCYPSSSSSYFPELQKFLLGAIRDTSSVGKYSNFHDNAIYTKGYDHPETIRLAYMFCSILDGSKTGLTVLPHVVQRDTTNHQKRSPAWKETSADRTHWESGMSNELNLPRPRVMPPFIMDVVFSQSKQYCAQKRSVIERMFKDRSNSVIDHALVKPWKEALDRAKRFQLKNDVMGSCIDEELDAIIHHVEEMHRIHKDKIGAGPGFTDKRIEHRQDILRSIAQDFAAKPDVSKMCFFSEDEVARLKASYAYLYDHKQSSRGWGQFPWDVAMRELGAIKAKFLGPSKTVQSSFYDRFVLKQSHLKRS